MKTLILFFLVALSCPALAVPRDHNSCSVEIILPPGAKVYNGDNLVEADADNAVSLSSNKCRDDGSLFFPLSIVYKGAKEQIKMPCIGGMDMQFNFLDIESPDRKMRTKQYWDFMTELNHWFGKKRQDDTREQAISRGKHYCEYILAFSSRAVDEDAVRAWQRVEDTVRILAAVATAQLNGTAQAEALLRSLDASRKGIIELLVVFKDIQEQPQKIQTLIAEGGRTLDKAKALLEARYGFSLDS